MNIHRQGRDQIRQLYQGYEAAFINAAENSNVAYQPEFVSNDFRAGQKVLSTVEEGLQNCDEFIISVAFITNSGIEPLMQTLRELERRGIHGRILTTNYLGFSEPVALERLHQFTNIDLRMYMVGDNDGFHTKGYIFRNDDLYQIMIGSSNLTISALTRNKEWNTCLYSMSGGAYTADLLEEFNELWKAQETQTYESFIDEYRIRYEITRQQRELARKDLQFETYTLQPNSMQVAFIKNMEALQEKGENKALLISATGTGKTYASAFALREQDPRRVLFLVHREQIAKQAIESYRKVFGSSKTFGLLSGNSKDYEDDYLFATMQTMAKEEVLHSFDPHAFETIVIDEVHKAGSNSYQRIIDYFQPQFLLGMTATPERTDGYDIYQLFDHNIAYEIRLQQALEEDLLCPFHYFGITDITIDGEIASDDGVWHDQEHELKEFNYLTADRRVDYIIENAQFYGHSGSRVKGLAFVSRRDVGEELSRKLNEHGLRTVFLSGSTSQELREHYIEMLETDDPNAEQLDYILTVDIFNEGVDIPQVNQVLLLRPTQSPIIFVQQLGRGLRKAQGKEFVVIIDFIGNYTNNYMIPIALSGDRSYNKDNMRRYVADGCRVIPGSSTIHFDEIARKRIYESIDTAKTNSKELLKEAYKQLKNKLGRIPYVADFELYGSIDIQKFFSIKTYGSYYDFLIECDKDEYKIRLSEAEHEIIRFLSQKLSKGKRQEDLWLLKELIDGDDDIDADVVDLSPDTPELVRLSVEHMLMNRFVSNADQAKFHNCVLIERRTDGYTLNRAFYDMLIQDAVFSQMVQELLYYGLMQNEKYYSNRYRDTAFVLNQKYTYEEVELLLNWDHYINAQAVSGYKYDSYSKTLPVFINYDKQDDAIQYGDRFIDAQNIVAHSKKLRTYIPGTRIDKRNSPDVDYIYKWSEEQKDNRIYLFVRKNKEDEEANEFYFLGEIEAVGEPEPKPIVQGGKSYKAFEINYRLLDPVRKDIYEYITE